MSVLNQFNQMWTSRSVCDCGFINWVSASGRYIGRGDPCPDCGNTISKAKTIRAVDCSVWWKPWTWGRFTVEVKE